MSAVAMLVAEPKSGRLSRTPWQAAKKGAVAMSSPIAASSACSTITRKSDRSSA
eukprot:CAMPEP_0115183960 /NCGR_PEP_ID=MMETSP0270-20121206/8717_2 /TAXON_ID=71861 /ORGANISM="Scrippsiella trochoidea, Strain CCMP3099" /LENGTH=53 /DNA_ID=CAMNT_0002597033 /DNA_START=393 /DNA_END=551 /DNA_ORIENTATION=-